MKERVNGRGIYSFFTVLGASAIILALHASALENQSIHAQTETVLLHNEQISFHRTLLEQEIDERLHTALHTAIFANSNPVLIREVVNKELETILTEYAHHPLIAFQEQNNWLEPLNTNSKVIVVDTEVPLVYAEYTLLAPLDATITVGNASGHFSVPAGYTVSATVIR